MTTKWEASMRQFIRKVADKYRDHHASDRDLLHRFAKQRDETAFAVLVRRHNQMVLGVGQRVLRHYQDAEDVCQATFLLLAQKANSVSWRDSVANWLYTAAYNLALRARDSAKRRQVREGKAQSVPPPDVMAEITSRDFQTVLDEELIRLPKKYSAPIVLCCLEGKSRDEASKYLSWPLVLVKSRLEEGRDLLRDRLTRRGILISTALASVTLAGSTAQAALSMTAIRATSQAALQMLAQKSIAGIVSAKVVTLIKGGAQTMLLSKVKVATVAMMVTALVTTAIVAMPQRALVDLDNSSANPKTGAKWADNAIQKQESAVPQQPSDKKNQEKINIQGKVLGVDGKPAAGAKLLLLSTGEEPVVLGRATPDGQFKVTVPKVAKDRTRFLVAQVEGTGIDFIRISDKSASDSIELRVVRDNGIQGRLIDTEGKAVEGAKVVVTEITVCKDNSLDLFLVEWKKKHPGRGGPGGVNFFYQGSGSFLGVTTDADGRFTITGAGAERAVELQISGAGIADFALLVANREGLDPKLYNQAADDTNATIANGSYGKSMLQGPNLTPVAEKERIIRGVVKDIDTGKPRAGIRVFMTPDYGTSTRVHLTGTTDAEGRYEIRGARKSKSYSLEVDCDRVTGHVACRVSVKDTPGFEPIIADIGVKKGIIITGRVIDAVTKKALPSNVSAGVLSDNPFVKKYPELSSFSLFARGSERDTEDGMFRIVTLPGPVVLMGGPSSQRMPGEELRYKPAAPDLKFPHYFNFEQGQLWVWYGPGGGMMPLQGNYCKVLILEPQVSIVAHDIIVESASALQIKIQDVAGRPISGTWVTGISPIDYENPVQINKDSCSAFHLEPGKPRLMVFYDPTEKLVGTLAFKGDEKESATVKLGQPGTVKGRLLDEAGKPLAKVIVDFHFPDRTASEIHQLMHSAIIVETDADGRFQFESVIPGPNFKLWFTRGSGNFEPVMKMDPRRIDAGGMFDFGEIKLKPRAED